MEQPTFTLTHKDFLDDNVRERIKRRLGEDNTEMGTCVQVPIRAIKSKGPKTLGITPHWVLWVMEVLLALHPGLFHIPLDLKLWLRSISGCPEPNAFCMPFLGAGFVQGKVWSPDEPTRRTIWGTFHGTDGEEKELEEDDRKCGHTPCPVVTFQGIRLEQMQRKKRGREGLELPEPQDPGTAEP